MRIVRVRRDNPFSTRLHAFHVIQIRGGFVVIVFGKRCGFEDERNTPLLLALFGIPDRRRYPLDVDFRVAP